LLLLVHHHLPLQHPCPNNCVFGAWKDTRLCSYLLVLLPDTYEACSNETRSGIVLIKRVEVVTVTLHGRWGRYTLTDRWWIYSYKTSGVLMPKPQHSGQNVKPVLRMIITDVPYGSFLLNKSAHRQQLAFLVPWHTLFIFH
jgi:hypothetical protein